MSPAYAGLTRRAFLGGALALAAAGAGCSTPRPSAAQAASVDTLTATQPFYIAHRGGGGNWPEMTAYAYAQAAQIPGLQALEISVCLSADGVLVCSHDPTTARMTGTPYTIAEETWATLSTLKVSGAETTEPDQPPQPLTRFDDVVEAYIGQFVLFVEPKVKAAADPLMVRMAALDQPERVVWKSPINSSSGFAEAKRRGFGTWGYVLNETAHTGRQLGSVRRVHRHRSARRPPGRVGVLHHPDHPGGPGQRQADHRLAHPQHRRPGSRLRARLHRHDDVKSSSGVGRGEIKSRFRRIFGVGCLTLRFRLRARPESHSLITYWLLVVHHAYQVESRGSLSSSKRCSLNQLLADTRCGLSGVCWPHRGGR